MPDLISYILVAAGMVVASYLLGHIVALAGGGQDEGNEFEYAFRRLTLGALLIVTLYAAANCAGATILAGTIPLLLLGARFKPLRWRRIKVSPAAALLFFGVFALLVALHYFAACDLKGNLYSLHYDHSFYASLANYVDRSGIESANVELMYPALQSPGIYHWFDVHLAALTGNLSGNYFNARQFITLPVSAGAAVLGLAAVIGRYCGRAGRKTPWLASLVFFVPVVLVHLIDSKYRFLTLPFHNIIPEKVHVMMCVTAWAILSKNKTLPLVIGGLLISTAAPALFTGAFIVLAAGFKAERRSGQYWKNVAALAFGTLWCVAFYTLTAKENPYFTSYLSIAQQIGRAFTESTLPLAKEYTEGFAIRIAMNLSPCVLMFALLDKADRRSVAALVKENLALVVAIVSGIVFSCLTWFVRDATQLASEVSVPFAFIMETTLLAMLFTSRRRVAKASAVLVVAAGAALIGFRSGTFRAGPMNADHLRELIAADGPIAWVDTEQRKEEGSELVRDPNYIVPFSAVRRLRNDYFPIRLDVYDIVYDPEDIRDYSVLASIENSTFCRWAESNKIPMNALRQAQTRFILEHNIRYVITPANDPWIWGRGFRIEDQVELGSRGYTLYRISYDDHPVQ